MQRIDSTTEMMAEDESDSRTPGKSEVPSMAKVPETAVAMSATGTLPPAKGKGLIGPLERSGKPFGGIVADWKRRMSPFYCSDWKEAFTSENRSICAASTMFLFFACLSPAVTFGMMFGDATGNQLGVVETIISSGLSGIIYAFFAGQPLCILGATGPELAYTAVFYNMCNQFGLEFLPARVWQGLWCSLITVLMAAFDLSSLMNHCTRFTEEIFSLLISLIFILGAILNVAKLYQAGNTVEQRAEAFLGTMICLGTYGFATWCKGVRKSTLFTGMLRNFLANYGVTLSICTATGLSLLFPEVRVDRLALPSKIEPSFIDPMTNQTRSWLVNPMGTHKPFPVWAIFATFIPAVGLAFLGYMDQNLTSLLVNRKDHNLRKPPAYHLDLLVCGVFIYPICSFLGLPFTHAATVRSMTHLASLSEREDVALEGGGKTSRVKRVIEQRVTHLMIHVLLICSLVLAPVLKLIPKTVLYGVFLFMGVGSLAGVQLYDRCALWFIWETDKYPQYDYVKKVSGKALHSFTFFQALMLAILYVLTRLDDISVVFPFFIGLLVFVRKAMACCWDKDALNALEGSSDITKSIGGGERKKRGSIAQFIVRHASFTHFPQAINGGVREVSEWPVEKSTRKSSKKGNTNIDHVSVDGNGQVAKVTPHANYDSSDGEGISHA